MGQTGPENLPPAYRGTDLKILTFYATKGAIAENHSTTICYGVLNAKSVRLDPPVADVYPALNRCISATPHRDTKYTLTAEGDDGKTATAEFTVVVKPEPGRK